MSPNDWRIMIDCVRDLNGSAIYDRKWKHWLENFKHVYAYPLS